MANKKVGWGMLAIALVFGMMVLGARNKEPPAFEAIQPITPDDQSAVVYFSGLRDIGELWDGETPIGTFREKVPTVTSIAWKTTPGEHFFIARASNWATIRADLEPNKRYVVHVRSLPSPLRKVKLVTFTILTPEDGEKWLKQTKLISFFDAWRTNFAQGKRLEEIQEHLQNVKSELPDVTLSGIHGY